MFNILPVYCGSKLLQENSYLPGDDGVSGTLLRKISRGLQNGFSFSSTPAWSTSFTPEYSMTIL